MLRPPYTRYERLYVYHLPLESPPHIEDPDLIGIWMEDRTAVLFFHQEKKELVARICRDYDCELIYAADLDYRDWEAGQHIQRLRVNGLTVAPVWEEGAADIRLDPSVIFGTGFHPTTRLCLDLLLGHLRAQAGSCRRVLDLGTGTGLLSIAAALTGACEVLAIDNNPLACQVAEANCCLNKVSDRVRIRQADLLQEEISTAGYDLVVANLYRGLLTRLFDTDTFWEADYFIISGFILAMEAELLAQLPARSLGFVDRRRSENWCVWFLARI